MSAMRPIKGTYKLVGYGLKEIREAFDREWVRARGLDLAVLDEAMSRADLLNGIFLWFLAQPESQRDQIIRFGCEDFMRRRMSDEPLPLIPGDGPPALPDPTRGIGAGGVGVEAKQGKPKRPNLRIKKDD